MQVRRVGGSGLEVSRLGLGTMSWGAMVDQYTAHDQLELFLGAGGTLIDTAPIYGDGNCEALLGQLLTELNVRDDLVIAGKAGLHHQGGEVVRDASRATLMTQLETSLRDVRTDHLDLWQVHHWDAKVPLEETISTLDNAVRQGKVRYAGICNYAGWQTVAAQDWFTAVNRADRLVSTQVEYSLVNRGIEAEVVPAAEYAGMSVLAWSPLGRGVLTGKYRSGIPINSRAADDDWNAFVAPYLERSSHIVDAVAKAADGLEVSASHIALAWLRDQPLVASAIVGARTTAQLAESLASEDLELPEEIRQALSDVSQGAR